MKKVVLLVFLCLAVNILAVSVSPTKQIPRDETLYVCGYQWGPPTSWNPHGGVITWPCQGGNDGHILVYETLFMLNLLTGELEPLLGELYEWTDDLTLKVTLQEGAHWQDGEPLTVDDVVYSFELGERYSLSYSVVWEHLEKVYKEDERTVIFRMNPDNPNRLTLLDQLRSVYVVPEHIWGPLETEYNYDIKEIRSFKNEDPIGSGPYKLYYHASDRIILERYDDYWGVKLFGKLPNPRYIVHPVFKSNEAGNLALEKGDVDVSQQFIPRIWEMWEKKNLPVGTWYNEIPYHIPGSIPAIIFNIHQYPLSVPEVRRAIAYAIDYSKISVFAMTQYSPLVRSSLILPYGAEAEFFDEELVEEYGWSYNPLKSIEILESIGCTKGSDGIYRMPDGTRLGPFQIECPHGWTDWMASIQIVAQSARKIGIDLQTYFPDAPVHFDDAQSGNFDIVMMLPAGWPGPTQPWSRFQFAMYSEVPPIGKLAFSNYGRYSNPAVDELIEEIAMVTDVQELKKLYGELDKIFMQDIPIIPLEYRPWKFYEYNEKHWKGFPTAENPYAPPTPIIAAGVKMLYQIEPT